MKKVYLVLIIVLVFGLSNLDFKSEDPIQALLLPHHLLVEEEIQQVYAEAASDSIETVVLFSPNHFGYGFNWIQTSQSVPNYAHNLGRKMIEDAVIFDEPKLFAKEHGVYVHYPFLEKAFPKAKILPLTFKTGTPQAELDKLVQDLMGIEKTVFIASIDFTHLETEEVALENDKRTIEYLEAWSQGEKKVSLEDLKELSVSESTQGIAIDSPEALYVLLRILELKGDRDFELKTRTSSFTETGVDSVEAMTSHILAVF